MGFGTAAWGSFYCGWRDKAVHFADLPVTAFKRIVVRSGETVKCGESVILGNRSLPCSAPTQWEDDEKWYDSCNHGRGRVAGVFEFGPVGAFVLVQLYSWPLSGFTYAACGSPRITLCVGAFSLKLPHQVEQAFSVQHECTAQCVTIERHAAQRVAGRMGFTFKVPTYMCDLTVPHYLIQVARIPEPERRGPVQHGALLSVVMIARAFKAAAECFVDDENESDSGKNVE